MTKKEKARFENHLCERGDELDNTAYSLAVAIVRNDPEIPADEAAQQMLEVMALYAEVETTNPAVAQLIEKTKAILKKQGLYNDDGATVSSNIADDDVLRWDMRYIGEINDVAEGLLNKAGIGTCHPYWEGDEDDNTPCYLSGECTTAGCPFKGQ